MRRQFPIAAAAAAAMLGPGAAAQAPDAPGPDGPAEVAQAEEAQATGGPKRVRIAREGPAWRAPARSPLPIPRGQEVTSQERRLTSRPSGANVRAGGPGALGLVGEMIEEAFDEEEQELEGDNLMRAALEPDTSDLPGIRKRGFMRYAVAPDPLMIAYDGERAMGVAMDVVEELQKFLAERRDEPGAPTVVVPMPAARDHMAKAVAEGQADFTSVYLNGEQSQEFDFTQPLLSDVNSIPVLGPEAPSVDTIAELAEVRLFVPEDSPYAEHVRDFNAGRVDIGKEPLEVRYVDPRLQDHDLLEMAEAGLIPGTIMADHKARFWSQIYTMVEAREDLKLTEARRIGWAVRTENPELLEALDAFAGEVKEGTLLGNMLMKRYYGETDWIEEVETAEPDELIAEVEPVIQEYSEIYGFESDLVLAQAYQESRLDQARRSHVGAIGVMQVMPTTAADPVVGIPDVTELEPNVQAGIKYLRWLRDTYYSEPEIAPLDQTLFSFAAYNAGPGGMQRARAKAREMGLDPNVWFENVEIAITHAVSQEPAIYVRNIFKYYITYRLMQELKADREAARETLAEVEGEIENLPLEQKIEALQEARVLIDDGEQAETPAGGEPERAPDDGAEEGQASPGPRFLRP